MSQILSFLMEQRWALHPPVLRALVQVVQRHLDGARLSQDQIDEIVAASPARQRERSHELTVRDGVATIPIHGVIARRASMVGGASQPQGTSVEAIRSQLRQAIESDDVRAILFDVDSPGGSVGGLPELADEIRAARGMKTIWAHVDGLAASAAYWLAAQADRIVATKGSEVGSIGVYTVVDDHHRRYEAAGIDTHVVSTGENKGVGVPGSKITTAQLATIQEGVAEYFGLFREAVQAGRAMSDEAFARVDDGSTWLAARAHGLGLIDAVGGLEETAAALRASVAGRRPATTSGRLVAVDTHPPAAAREGLSGANLNESDSMNHETIEALEQAYPELCAQLRSEGRDQAAAEATQAERDRCARILRAASPSQLRLAAEHVAEGTDVATVLEAFIADPRRSAHQRLQELEAAAPAAIDGTAAEPAAAAEPRAMTADEQIQAEADRIWAEDPDAERIYQTPQALVHYLKAKRLGLTCS
jgi:signal peptide peptidase SppA